MHKSPSRRSIVGLACTAGVLAAMFVLPSAGAAADSGFTASLIPTAAQQRFVAFDAATDTAYFASQSAEQLTLINGTTDAVTGTVALGGVPEGIAVDPDTDSVYVEVDVAAAGGTEQHYLEVLDDRTNAITATVALPDTGALEGIAVDTATDTVYVAVLNPGAVLVIDGATNSVTGSISLPSGKEAIAIAVDESTDVIWVSVPDDVFAISAASGAITSTVSVPADALAIAVDPSTDTVYVGGGTASGVITVIDGASGAVTGTVSVPTRVTGLAVDPGAGVVYATSAYPPAGTDDFGATWVIDVTSDAVTDTIGRGGNQVALDPATGSLFEAPYIALPDSAWVFTPSATDAESPVMSLGGVDAVTMNAADGGFFNFGASSDPAATFTESGALPSDATLQPGGTLLVQPDADTQLFGVPADGGVYPITITASNGVAPDYSVPFTLTVDQAPIFSPAMSATFRTGKAVSFPVTVIGYPDPTVAEAGALPAGLTFTSGGVIAGTPGAHTGGVYKITLTASNGIAPDATQTFTITVDQPPAFTTARSVTFKRGARHTFTFRTTGYPAASLSKSGALPKGVTFKAGRDGTATLSGKPPRTDKAHTWTLTITAKNAGGTVRETFKLKIT